MAEEKPTVIVHTCGSSSDKCKCQCPDGPCEHKWDGKSEDMRGFDKNGRPYISGSTVTCSRCGMSAFSHSMWVSP